VTCSFSKLVGGGLQAGSSVVEFFLALAEFDFQLGLRRLGQGAASRNMRSLLT